LLPRTFLPAYLVLPSLLGIALNGTSSVLYATIGDVIDKTVCPRAFRPLLYHHSGVPDWIVPLRVRRHRPNYLRGRGPIREFWRNCWRARNAGAVA